MLHHNYWHGYSFLLRVGCFSTSHPDPPFIEACDIGHECAYTCNSMIFNLEPPKVFFNLCNTKEIQTHKILVLRNNNQKMFSFSENFWEIFHASQREFLSKNTQMIVFSRETSQGTDLVGSWTKNQSCSCSTQQPISCRIHCDCVLQMHGVSSTPCILHFSNSNQKITYNFSSPTK